ncbi:hypothetical protein [Lutimonas zeaxanthinifaciens]|uniref:hypothetical protein n=1 Tax=Lutimonas zeaxanthinifaciens TaxID=3060215 RepID=UPI00265D2C2B|nr:hypothetical protein [Lutimonas sp. YSD2104]WKK66757.1 hypothetical protein QZH61_03855 [Lutimonas sp. YSD2104]
MNKKIVIFLLLLAGFTACKKQEIQLPLINSPGLSEIQNHSSIWIFRDSTNAGIVPRLNKNNKIINTHWIYNIDKRLPMKDVLPLLIKMQENKNKPSMHKKGDMESYFSYADLSGKKISLLPFSQTNFSIVDMENLSDELSSAEKDIVILKLRGKSLEINNQILARDSIGEILNRIQRSSKAGKTEYKEPVFILQYSGETCYQDYLSLKALLNENEINTSSTEYLLTVK